MICSGWRIRFDGTHMGPLTKIAAAALDGTRWLPLPVATGCAVLAVYAKDGAERLRR